VPVHLEQHVENQEGRKEQQIVATGESLITVAAAAASRGPRRPGLEIARDPEEAGASTARRGLEGAVVDRHGRAGADRACRPAAPLPGRPVSSRIQQNIPSRTARRWRGRGGCIEENAVSEGVDGKRLNGLGDEMFGIGQGIALGMEDVALPEPVHVGEVPPKVPRRRSLSHARIQQFSSGSRRSAAPRHASWVMSGHVTPMGQTGIEGQDEGLLVAPHRNQPVHALRTSTRARGSSAPAASRARRSGCRPASS